MLSKKTGGREGRHRRGVPYSHSERACQGSLQADFGTLISVFSCIRQIIVTYASNISADGFCTANGTRLSYKQKTRVRQCLESFFCMVFRRVISSLARGKKWGKRSPEGLTRRLGAWRAEPTQPESETGTLLSSETKREDPNALSLPLPAVPTFQLHSGVVCSFILSLLLFLLFSTQASGFATMFSAVPFPLNLFL